MDGYRLKAESSSRADRWAVEGLVEDIRLMSLNIAIAAAKLRIESDSKAALRSKVSELVNLSLDTVNNLARVLKALNTGRTSGANDPAEQLTELQRIEKAIFRRAREIAKILHGPDADA
jgi:hypothetical protein